MTRFRRLATKVALTRSDKAISAVAIAPSAAWAALLIGFMTWRVRHGSSPMPDHAGPMVMSLSAAIPTAFVALANFLRLRRDG